MAKQPDEYKTVTPREVRARLAEIEMHQYEFAERVGLSAVHIGDWLHERESVSRVAQMRIADVYEDLGKSEAEDEAS